MEANELKSKPEADQPTARPRQIPNGGMPVDAEALAPIPTPPGARWREFRLRMVPGVVFLVSLWGAFWLWLQQGSQGVFVGSAEARQATVSSPIPGVLRQLAVTPFQMVRQGDLVAVVAPLDARQQLSLLQMRLQLAARRNEPTLSQRTAVDFERLRADVLNLKVEIARDRVNLNLAETELKRNQELFQQKLLSEDAYDLSLKNRDALRVEVVEKEKAYVELEAGLRHVESITTQNASESTLRGRPPEDLSALQDMLASTTNWGPITLTAPISGMVSVIHRGAGENVSDGEAVVTIQATEAERIVGYLRQPLPFEPQVGQPVEVKSRDLRPKVALTAIAQIGVRLEPITNALAMTRPGLSLDLGLPIVLALPPGLIVRPGELFDLTARPMVPIPHP